MFLSGVYNRGQVSVGRTATLHQSINHFVIPNDPGRDNTRTNKYERNKQKQLGLKVLLGCPMLNLTIGSLQGKISFLYTFKI